MNLRTLKAALDLHPEKIVRFVLPDGAFIPARYHVTEVGHVAKKFIDCGGTVRVQETCLLQAWVPEGDPSHRLTAGKLTRILDLSAKVLLADDLPVELEYESAEVAQYTADAIVAQGAELQIELGSKKTDCLAREACGLEPAGTGGCGCGDGSGKCC
jgi:hypothetical protein